MRANAVKALLAILRSASKPGPKGERPLIPWMSDLQTPPKPKKRHVTVPVTVDEIHVIIKAMPERYALTVPLAVTCGGLRIGEVCPLQRKHLLNDFTVLDIAQGRPTMSVDKVGLTKNENSDRHEPIPRVMEEMLRELCDKYGITEPDDFLFPAGRNPKDPLHPNTLRGLV